MAFAATLNQLSDMLPEDGEIHYLHVPVSGVGRRVRTNLVTYNGWVSNMEDALQTQVKERVYIHNAPAILNDALANKEDVFYHTDHHWTPLGAYYAYAALGDELGYTPLPLSEFRAETVSREFYGTIWSKSGIYAASPDEITLYRYDGDTDFKVTDADSGEVYLEGLYDKSKLEVKDKYSLFLGGDYGHVKISDGSEKPTLLVVKDSYFDALAPFLARHFELDVIDLRYTSARDSVAEYAAEQGIDNILILFGEDSDSLLAATTLTKLKFKLK
jgi:hypothetical protein